MPLAAAFVCCISNTPIGRIGRSRYCSALGWREQVLFVWRAGQRISCYYERARVREDMTCLAPTGFIGR